MSLFTLSPDPQPFSSYVGNAGKQVVEFRLFQAVQPVSFTKRFELRIQFHVEASGFGSKDAAFLLECMQDVASGLECLQEFPGIFWFCEDVIPLSQFPGGLQGKRHNGISFSPQLFRQMLVLLLRRYADIEQKNANPVHKSSGSICFCSKRKRIAGKQQFAADRYGWGSESLCYIKYVCI